MKRRVWSKINDEEWHRNDGVRVKNLFSHVVNPWAAHRKRRNKLDWLAGKAKSCRTFKTAEAAMKAVDKTWP